MIASFLLKVCRRVDLFTTLHAVIVLNTVLPSHPKREYHLMAANSRVSSISVFPNGYFTYLATTIIDFAAQNKPPALPHG